MQSVLKRALGVACFTLLAGCGGGGEGASSAQPAPGTTFALQAAVVNLLTAGYQKTATVSGAATASGVSYPVSGTVTLTLTPAVTATTFASQPALQTTQSVVGSVTVNGQSINISSSQQGYVSATSYAPIGDVASGEYCVASTPSGYPVTVTVGQSGSIVTYACYSDNTLTASTRTETLTFAVSAGPSANTATVSLIAVFTDPSHQTVFSAQDNYLIDTSGNITFVSGSVTQTVSGVALNLAFSAP